MRYTITVITLLTYIAPLHAQNRLVSWGTNNAGQLGDGIWDLELGTVSANRAEPMPVTCFDDWKVITANVYTTFGIRQDGSLWMWGVSTSSGLAPSEREYDQGTLTIQTVAKQVGTDKNWQSVRTSGSCTAAIKTDGTLWTWGQNDNGVLGQGHTAEVVTPQQVGTDTDWEQVDTRDNTMFALKTNGSLWTWGKDRLMSDGTLADQHTPMRYGIAWDWMSLGTGVGSGHMAIKWDRSLWALGASATRVGTDLDWKAVHIAWDFMLAQKMDGSLWAWGQNDYGQLGDGTFTDHSTPQRIGTATDWVAMSGGNYFAVAVKSDGTLWGWGGQGVLAHGNVPQRIGTASNWKTVTASNDYVLAIQDDAFNPMPMPLDLGPDISSCTATADITANITGADFYKWYTPSTTLRGTETLTASSPGTYKLVVNRSGCRLTDQINVSLNNTSDPLFQSAGTTIDNCPGFFDIGSPITFTPASPVSSTLSWAFGNGVTSTESTPQYTYPTAGQYTVTLSNGCGGSTSHVVDVLPRLSLGGDVASCGEPVTLATNIPAAESYHWQAPNGTTLNTAAITAIADGTYTVTVVQAGCSQTAQVQADFNKSTIQPDFTVVSAGITLDDAATILSEIPLTFVGTGLESAKTYTWSLGDGTTETRRSFEHAYTNTGDMIVTLRATDDNDCETTTEKQFNVRNLIITDAISDNGDGKNDKLRFNPLPYTSDLIVTDQHGRTVFTASPYQDDFTGSGLSSGVYYYELRFREIGKSYKGFVHVMR